MSWLRRFTVWLRRQMRIDSYQSGYRWAQNELEAGHKEDDLRANLFPPGEHDYSFDRGACAGMRNFKKGALK